MLKRWKKELAELVGSAEDDKEIDTLLKAILTPTEHAEMAKRWQIIKQLNMGASQRDICASLSAAVVTVTRGSRELKYGNGTFLKFHKRLYGK